MYVFLKDFYLILNVEEAVCIGRPKYKVNTMLWLVNCNYRLKETKLFAVIYFSTSSTWQAAVPLPSKIQINSTLKRALKN